MLKLNKLEFLEAFQKLFFFNVVRVIEHSGAPTLSSKLSFTALLQSISSPVSRRDK